MFGIIADFFASIVTILFPIFASYKALRTSDPTQLTPWLIYWVILSLILLVESWTVFIIGWVPFYSWIRLFALSYLVLPQTQGAKLLYTRFVEPFIAQYESQIEVFIGDLHERASKAGMGYVKDLIDLIRSRLLGLPPSSNDHPTAPTTAGYAQSLLSRFAMPSARAPTPSDFYSLLSGAVAAASTTTNPSSSSPHATSRSTTTPRTPLIPSTITSNAEKQTFLTSQRDKLAVLMRALDREQRDLDLAYGNTPPGLDVDRRSSARDTSSGSYSHSQSGGVEMKKNRSENSFQNIEREDLDNDDDTDMDGDHGSSDHRARDGEGRRRQVADRRTTSGGWYPSSWFGGADGADAGRVEVAREVRNGVRGMSSSVDRGGR